MNRSPNRWLAAAFGAGYVLLGVLGFTATSGIDFFAPQGGLLFGLLQVNPVQNVVHIVMGAALLLAAVSSVSAARAVNSAIGTTCLVLGLAGLFLIGTEANILAVNVANNLVHFVSATVLLAVGLGAEKGVRSGASSTA